MASSRPARLFPITTVLIVAIGILAIMLGTGLARPSAEPSPTIIESTAPATPAEVTAGVLLPLPLELKGLAIDPPPAIRPADVATAFGLGSSARVAFMRVSGRAGASDRLAFGGGTDVWVILETDRTIPILGPEANPHTPAATYCWSFVEVDMTPIDGICVSYGDAESVPKLP